MDSSIIRTDTIKDLGTQLDSKLHFRANVDYIFLQSVLILGVIRPLTCSSSSIDNVLILYLNLVRPKLAYASTVWNSTTSTDAKNLERIQLKFIAPCQYLFFIYVCVTYEGFLTFLKLHTLYNRRLTLDALFYISVYLGWKCCLSLLDTSGIRVPAFNFRNSCLFTATCHNYPSAECISAASHVCKDVDIFRKPFTSLKQILS
jgi:hypothetical protein